MKSGGLSKTYLTLPIQEAELLMAASGRDFHHPYDPYPIQNQFMNAVYDCLEQGNVGIFESPTGTGKSLSLICGSLTWLRDHKQRMLEGEVASVGDDVDVPDWLLDHARLQKRTISQQRAKELSGRLEKIRAKERRARERAEFGQPPTKRQKQIAVPAVVSEDANFVLDDYESDQEVPSSKRFDGRLDLDSKTQALLDQLGGSSSAQANRNDEEIEEEELKVFFCSRTHSQLQQFTSELRKVKLPSIGDFNFSRHTSDEESGAKPKEEDIKQVALGSRKNLCINPRVAKLGNATAINEGCIELQEPSTPADKRCPFLPNQDKASLVHDFRDHTLATIRDIEDLGHLGKKIGICPYYASRNAARLAEVVTLPYPLLLQKSAREALGISLKNHVVIVDEAHNLIEAISNVYSVSVTSAQLQNARAKVGIYLQKFRNRLKGKNKIYITHLVRVIDSIMTYFETMNVTTGVQSGCMVSSSELLAGKALDQVNLFKLMQYLHVSKLARKVDGYNEKLASNASSIRPVGKAASSRDGGSAPALLHVEAFLIALTYPANEGRFFYSRGDAQASTEPSATLRYLLLDPTQHFKEVVEHARAVILAGGTMSPMSEYTEQLFDYLPAHKVQTLSCGHVIPTSNLLALPITHGPTGLELNFTFGKRGSDSMLVELGQSIIEIAHCIPDGLVVFFPSYAYLDSAIACWQKTSIEAHGSLLSWIQAEKPIFRESKGRSVVGITSAPANPASPEIGFQDTTTADSLLADYSAKICDTSNQRGALLFAVIGGALSEGINFADRLGRGIVVVGLPFPNAQSPEFKERLKFVEQKATRMTTVNNSNVSQKFYINVCMRAVNQSIGRAIRHKDDYAAILLLDRRYDREQFRSKLPEWIKNSLYHGKEQFTEGMQLVRQFFEGKGDRTSHS